MRVRIAAHALLLSSAIHAVASAEPTTAPADESSVVTRVYDVGDLVRSTPNHPAGDGESIAAPQSASIEPIAQLLTNVVDANSWKVNGGLVGSISALPSNAVIVVEQTEPNQAAIAKLLAEIRAQPSARTMVSARASWLMLDADDVRAIYERARKEKPAGATIGPAIVDDATLARAKVYCQGQNTCFDGQTVAIVGHREWSVVTNVSPIVANNAVGYSAQTARASSGVTLQFTPQLTADGSGVALDLQSVVNETRAPTDESVDVATLATTQSSDTRIDRQDVVKQSLAATIRLPLGQRVLVAGMTLEPSATGDGRQLYLVVQVDSVR